MDSYKVLGLRRGATRQEIRKAYLLHARKWHPDRNRRRGAVEKFLRIHAAYESLLATLPKERGPVSEHFSSALSREVSEEIEEARERSASFGVLGIRISVHYRVA